MHHPGPPHTHHPGYVHAYLPGYLPDTTAAPLVVHGAHADLPVSAGHGKTGARLLPTSARLRPD